jgi:hypothetical protein
MDAKLTFKYDREGDILYINKQPPYPEQESEELGDGVIAWLNPRPERSKTLRCYSSRPGSCRNDLFELPVASDLRLARKR